MTTLHVKFDASTSKRFPVLAHFAGQLRPQPAFLTLDIRTGELDADYSSEIGNGVPADVFHDLVLRFPLSPETSAAEIESIISDNKDLFQSILDEAEEVWDGSNWVGSLSARGRDIFEELGHHNFFCACAEGGIIDLPQWVEDNPFPKDGQSLESFAQDIIDSDGENNYFFIEPYESVEQMLGDLRDVWTDYLYAGREIPKLVAQHLIEHGTCDDSAWMDELREFAGQ